MLLFSLALALRCYQIEQQSLWADEGGTLALASRSLARILIETLADVHPPLYYWLLHGWISLTGATVVAARGFSAVCGAAAVVVTVVLARRWYGTQAGVVAGALALVAPFAVEYSQEARMYSLVLLLAVALMLVFDAFLATSGRRWLAGYLLLALALFSTHYYAVILVATTALLGLCLRRPFSLRWAGVWVGLHLPLALVFLAMVTPSQAQLTGWTATKQAAPAWVILSDLLQTLSLGRFPPAGWPFWVILSGLLLIAGILAVLSRRLRSDWLVLAWLVLPVVAMLVFSSYYKPRFLLFVLPAFQILVATGMVHTLGWVISIIRKAGNSSTMLPEPVEASDHHVNHSTLLVLLVAVVLLGPAMALTHVWNDPSTWRDEYRGAAQAIASTIGPDDALILNGQSQIDTLNYYLRSPQPRFLLPRIRPLDQASVTADLVQIAASHRRIYGLFYVIEESDPQGVMTSWLDGHAYASGARWYGNILLRSWETGNLHDQMHAADHRFGPGLRLTGLAYDQQPLHAGDGLRVHLQWDASSAPDPTLVVFLHLVDSHNQLVSQYDGPLLSGAWQPGTAWEQRAGLLLPAKVAPGNYRLLLGLYDPQRNQRVLLADGQDTLMVGDVVIVAR